MRCELCKSQQFIQDEKPEKSLKENALDRPVGSDRCYDYRSGCNKELLIIDGAKTKGLFAEKQNEPAFKL